jgi:hypothetical protein
MPPYRLEPLSLNDKGKTMSYSKTIFLHNLLLFIGLFILLASQHVAATPKKFEILHLFDRISAPPGIGDPKSLIQGKDGNLYGGAFGSRSGDEKAVFFKINLTQPTQLIYSNFLTVARNFGNIYSIRSFIEARNGTFYGVGLGGGGFAGPEYLFKITPSSPPVYNELMDLPTVKSDATLFSEFVEGKGGNFMPQAARAAKAMSPS